MLEITDRDASGRICKLTVGNHNIRTPNIFIVVNPSKMTVETPSLKDIGADLIITNSYIIKKSGIEVKDIHDYLGWKGPIYTDSGTFQMFSKGVTDIDPKEIIDFQKKLKSDIITPVDMFTLPTDSKKVASQKLKETIKRIKDARKKVEFLVGPIQGGMYLDLRKKACKEVAKIKPDLFAIGGIVPLMQQYRFKELVDIIMTCKQNLPTNIPVHAFGAGHPMVFSLLTAMGCDLFDSAMYSLAAYRDGYLTVNGTLNLKDIEEFPCSCPFCSNIEPELVKKLDKPSRSEFLAKHNLCVTFSELKRIRQAIREDRLWELVQIRARAHPALLEAFTHLLKKYGKFLVSSELVSKKSAFFYGGEESKYRPEVIRAKQWLKRISGKGFVKKPFGKIPIELKNVYPLGQSLVPGFKEKKGTAPPEKIVEKTIDYQYGKGSSKKLKNIIPEVSGNTGRIRRVWKGKKLLGTIRFYDGFFVPTLEGAKLIKMKKVFINKDAAEFVKKGKSVFAKFVVKTDEIFPGEEVSIFYKKKLIGIGRALLNSKEMKDFERGVAVKIRT